MWERTDMYLSSLSIRCQYAFSGWLFSLMVVCCLAGLTGCSGEAVSPDHPVEELDEEVVVEPETAPISEATPAATESEPAVAVDVDYEAFFGVAAQGELAAVQTALMNGADVNHKDENNRTALMLAAFDGHTATVQALLGAGATVDVQDMMGRTALMYSASGPNPETVALLLKHGAAPDIVDNEEHFTALMFAAAEGQTPVVELLVAHGADKTLMDIDGDTARSFAAQNGHTAIVSILEK